MGKSGSAPQPIDPYQSAAAQYQYGTQAGAYNAAINRVNTSGPGGSVNYSITGRDPSTGAPIYTQSTNLSPTSQKIYDLTQGAQVGAGQAAQGLLGNYGSALSDPYSQLSGVHAVQQNADTSHVPGIAGAGDLAGFTNQARDAAYKQQTQYLDPQYSQQQEQLDAQLRNSGAHPGDPAYDNAMKLFTNQKQQAYESAFNNANTQGLAEQQALYSQSAGTNQQLFGQALQSQQAANQGQSQAYNQGVGKQDLLINALNALKNGGSVGNSGQVSGLAPGQSNISSPDIQSAFNQQYQGQLNNYNANVAQSNANTAAGASILGAVLAAFL